MRANGPAPSQPRATQIVPESVTPESDGVILIPLQPRETLPVVMVWSREGDDPAVTAFRSIVEEWLGSR